MTNAGVKIAVLLLFALAVFTVWFYVLPMENTLLKMSVSGISLDIELADTPQKRTLGLSGRKTLSENEGMLFVFPESAPRQFWMKDMNFALDIIWIDENKKVVGITRNALPESYPEKLPSPRSAQYVLEVNAGFADLHNIKIGDKADFELSSFFQKPL